MKKWVNLGIDSQDDRLRVAGILCESGYQVYCKSVKSPYKLSSEHYVCVLINSDEITKEGDEE